MESLKSNNSPAQMAPELIADLEKFLATIGPPPEHIELPRWCRFMKDSKGRQWLVNLYPCPPCPVVDSIPSVSSEAAHG